MSLGPYVSLSLEQDILNRKKIADAHFQAGQNIDAGTMSRLLSIQRNYGWMDPGAQLSLAQAGYGGFHQEVGKAAQLALKAKLREQQFKALLPQVNDLGDLKSLSKKDLAQFTDRQRQQLAHRAISGALDNGGIGASLGDVADVLPVVGSVKALAEGQGVETAFARAVPGEALLEKVYSGAGDQIPQGTPLGNTARAVTQTAALAANTPLQFVQGQVRSHANDISNLVQGDTSPGTVLSALDPTGSISQIKNVESNISQTDVGQVGKTIAEGNTPDLGSGWLPDPNSPIGKAQAQAARAAAPTINGHAFTLGRFYASVLPADSTGFNVVSGLIDAGVALKADPMQMLLTSSSEARAANKFFTPEPELANETAANTGLYATGAGQTLDPHTAQGFLDAPKNAPTFDRLAATKSPSEIWRATGKRWSPDLTYQVSQADSPQAVKDVLTPHLGTDIPGPFSVKVPGGFNYTIRNGIDSTAIAGIMPERIINIQDPKGTLDTMDKLMQTAHIPVSVRTPILDRFIADAATGGNKYTGLNMMSDVIGQKLLDSGISKQEADRLSSLFPESTKLSRLYDLDQITKTERIRPGIVIDAAGQPIPTPELTTEWLNSNIQLPDATTLRRSTSKFAQVFSHPAYTGTSAVLDKFMQEVWKPLHLVTRIGFPLRVVMDSQASLAANGYTNLYQHPIDTISMMIGANMDEKWAQRLAKLPGIEPSYLWNGTGAPILDHFDQQVVDAMGGGWAALEDPTKVALNSFSAVPISHSNAPEGVVSELMRLRGDARVRGLLEQPDAQAAKDWFWGSRTVTSPEGAHIPTGEPFAHDIPELFHGTSQRFDAPSVGTGSGAGNLLGPGFYATDNPEVAASYMTKGKGTSPTVFSAKWAGEQAPRVVDAEAPMPRAVRSTVSDWWNSQINNPINPLDVTVESADKVAAEIERGAPLTHVIRSIRESLASTGGMSRSEANEIMDSFAYRMEEHADILRYSGGVRTGNLEHNAYVVLDPSQVSTSELSRASVSAQAEIPNSGKALRESYIPYTHDLNNGHAAYAAANPGATVIPLDFETRGGSDAWVQTILDRAHDITAGNTELDTALRTGAFSDGTQLWKNNGLNKSAIDRVAGMVENGDTLPQSVKVRDTVFLTRSDVLRNRNLKDQAVRYLFDHMLTLPDKYVDRSPAYVQSYWGSPNRVGTVERYLPYLNPEDRASLLQNAEEANLPGEVLKRLRAAPVNKTNPLTLDQLHDMAKSDALDKIVNLVHDLHSRSQFFDMTRLMFPFGDAFRRIAQRWATTIWENPNAIYRAQQGYTAAKQAGFFHKDPITGEMVFSFPGSEWLTDKLIGVPIPLQGSVQSLSMVGEGYPGFGPAVTVPAQWFLPDTPQTDGIAKILWPFGRPDDNSIGGTLTEQLEPAWAQKVAVALGLGGPPDQTSFNNTVGSIMNYLASSGDYNLHGPHAQAETARMLNDAKSKAKLFYVIRGAAQMMSPTAPMPKWMIEDKTGKLQVLQVVKDDYRNQLQKLGPDGALKWLLDHYGSENFFAAQAFSSPVGYGVPVTKEGQDWARENPDVKSKYPNTYGLFAPSTGPFDITAFEDQFATGDRTSLTPEQQIALANNRVGMWLYHTAKDKLIKSNGGAPLDHDQQAGLDAGKKWLMKRYPGFQITPYDQNRLPRALGELTQASTDSKLASTPAGKGLNLYLAARDQINQAAVDQYGLKSAMKGKDAAGLRAGLRAAAAWIIKKYPDFAPMWEQVLSHELTRDVDVPTASSVSQNADLVPIGG